MRAHSGWFQGWREQSRNGFVHLRLALHCEGPGCGRQQSQVLVRHWRGQNRKSKRVFCVGLWKRTQADVQERQQMHCGRDIRQRHGYKFSWSQITDH